MAGPSPPSTSPAAAANGAPVRASGRASRQPVVDPLTAAYQRGDVPREIMESYRIVDPKSDAGAVAQQYFGNVLRVMFNPMSMREGASRGMDFDPTILRHDFDRQPFRILLSTRNDAIAWPLYGSRPPTIILGQGLWNSRMTYSGGRKEHPAKIANFSDLAIVLGEAAIKLKQYHANQTEPRDAQSQTAAWRGVGRLLYHMGLSQGYVTQYIDKIMPFERADSEDAYKAFIKMSTVELRTAKETMSLANADAELRGAGALGVLAELADDPTVHTVPEEVVRFCKDARHESALAAFLATKPGYTTGTMVEKLDVLREFLQSSDLHIQVRIDDISREVEAIKRGNKETIDKPQRIAAGAFADGVLDYACAHPEVSCGGLYQKVGALIDREGRPIGRLSKISSAAKELHESIDGWDPEEEETNVIEDDAAAFIKLVEAEPAFPKRAGRALMQTLKWPGYKMPDLSEVPVEITWTKVRQAVEQSTSTHTLHAALLLGYSRDPVIVQYLGSHPALVERLGVYWVESGTKKSGRLTKLCEIHPGPHEGRTTISELRIKDDRAIGVTSAGDDKSTGRVAAQHIDKAIAGRVHTEMIDTPPGQRISANTLAAAMDLSTEVAGIEVVDLLERRPELAHEFILSHAESTTETELALRLRKLSGTNSDEAKRIIRELTDVEAGSPLRARRNIGVFCARADKRITFAKGFGLLMLQNPDGVFSPQEHVDVLSRLVVGPRSNAYVNDDIEPESLVLTKPLLQVVLKYPAKPSAAALIAFVEGVTPDTPGGMLAKALATAEFDGIAKTAAVKSQQAWKFLQLLGAGTTERFATNVGKISAKALAAVKKQVETGTVEEAARALQFVLEAKIYDRATAQDLIAAFAKRAQEEWKQAVVDWQQAIFRICSRGRVQIPYLRSELLDVWAKTVCETHKCDDGTPDYRDKVLREIVGPVSDSFERADRGEALEKLLWELDSQRDLSYAVEEEIRYSTHSERMNDMLGMELASKLLPALRASLELREAMQTFLMSNNTLADRIALVNASPKLFSGADDYTSVISEAELKSDPELNAIFFGPLQSLKVLHDSFSRGSLQTKTAIFKQLLVDRNGMVSKESIKRAVADTFPETMEYYQEARTLLEKHLDVYESYSRDVILAALMVSRQGGGGSGPPMTAGRAAALFCESMGGAYMKCGQKAESDQSLDSKFRADLAENMKHLKFDGARPTRVEVWHHIAREPEMLAGVKRVGRVEGSASTAFAVNFELTSGEVEIAAVMRVHSMERITFGFTKIAATADSYGPDSVIGRNLGRLGRAGAARAEIECNTSIAPKQYAIGYRLFHGVKVKVNGETVSYDCAQVTKAGRTYYRMTKMPGIVVAKVMEDPDRKDVADRYAMANVALFVCHAVHGILESDRHTGQANEQPNGTLGQYDMKALLVDPKTATYRTWEQSDYDQVAELIANVVLGGGKISSQAFVDAEAAIIESGRAISEFVTEIQTGQLALGENITRLNEEQLKASVMAGLQKGMHPKMAKSVVAQVLQKVPNLGAFKSMVEGPLEQSLITGKFDGMLGMMLGQYGIGLKDAPVQIELPDNWRDELYKEAYGTADVAAAA